MRPLSSLSRAGPCQIVARAQSQPSGAPARLAVISANPDLLHRPRVKVISDSMGVPLGETVTLDLAKDDPATGRPVRTIIKTTDPQKYGIRVSDYLIA